MNLPVEEGSYWRGRNHGSIWVVMEVDGPNRIKILCDDPGTSKYWTRGKFIDTTDYGLRSFAEPISKDEARIVVGW